MNDTIVIKNSIENGQALTIYDSFANEDNDYLGKLTLLGTVKDGASLSIQPINPPTSVIVAFDDKGNAINRYISLYSNDSFVITKDDLIRSEESRNFVNYIVTNPSSELAIRFSKLGGNSSEVDDFFKQTDNYRNCNYGSCMLALINATKIDSILDIIKVTQITESEGSLTKENTYSLSTIIRYLCKHPYPEDLPDISLKNCSLTTEEDTLHLRGIVDLRYLPFESSIIADNIVNMLQEEEIMVSISLDYSLGLNIFGTRMLFTSDDINIHAGSSNIAIKEPKALLDIATIWKFVEFQLSGKIPFNIFNKKFEAYITMTIDNIEASIGVEVYGDEKSSLPPPPIMRGVHFDEFGVEMGMIFEPPSIALGIMGKFHIGEDNTIIELDDNNFALICGFEGEIPNPLYLSFYIPKLDFQTLIKLFTNTTVDINPSIHFHDLSFKWAENPLEQLVLPDGTLADIKYGFSGYLNLFGLSFYGNVELSLDGIEGLVTMSPFNFGNILKLSGNGEEVTIKVDENGNSIKNNQIATSKEMDDAIKNAKPKTIISSGGPKMSISSSSTPLFTLSIDVSFLDLFQEKVNVVIDDDGISFEIDNTNIIKSKIRCMFKKTMNSLNNNKEPVDDNAKEFTMEFSYGLDFNVPLPTINGFNLGSINVNDNFNLKLIIVEIKLSSALSLDGSFIFQDETFNFSVVNLDINISTVADIIEKCKSYIIENSENIFNDITQEAEKWAGYVKKEVILEVEDVAKGLKLIFNKDAKDTATIMKNVGYSSTMITTSLNNAYGLNPMAITGVLQNVGFSNYDIAIAFKNIGGQFIGFISDTFKKIVNILNPFK